MKLKEILNRRNMSVLECSRKSGIPYTTLLQLVNGKTSVEGCSSLTLYKLSQMLGISMDQLFEELSENVQNVKFSTFKSSLCHRVKECGDLGYLIETLEKDEVGHLWRMCRYAEAFYTLGMVDYLCRIHEIPCAKEYDDIRKQKLDKPVLPEDIVIASNLGDDQRVKEFYKKVIPEFSHFNIYEENIRDVV